MEPIPTTVFVKTSFSSVKVALAYASGRVRMSNDPEAIVDSLTERHLWSRDRDDFNRRVHSLAVVDNTDITVNMEISWTADSIFIKIYKKKHRKLKELPEEPVGCIACIKRLFFDPVDTEDYERAEIHKYISEIYPTREETRVDALTQHIVENIWFYLIASVVVFFAAAHKTTMDSPL